MFQVFYWDKIPCQKVSVVLWKFRALLLKDKKSPRDIFKVTAKVLVIRFIGGVRAHGQKITF